MALQKLAENVEVIQTLGVYPNQEKGLSGPQLQEKFDKGNRILKNYLNEQVVPAHNQLEEGVAAYKEVTDLEIAEIKEEVGKVQEDVSALKETVGSMKEDITEDISQNGLKTSAVTVKQDDGKGVTILSGGYEQTETDQNAAVAEFYGTEADEKVILRYVAQGVEDHDAVNKGQMDTALAAVKDAVLYTKQTLTIEQQAQARENIGVRQVQTVYMAYDADTDEAESSVTYAEAKSLLMVSKKIQAFLQLRKDNTTHVATTQTVYADEDTQVCFDFAGLGILKVSDEDVWSFTEHEAGGGSADGAVLYTEQTLTDEQKAQARANIGAASEDAVKGSSVIYEDFTPTIDTGSYYTTGLKKVTTSTGACTEVIPVKSGDKFLITSAYGWAGTLITEFDGNDAIINCVGNSSGSAVVVTDYEYTVPDGVSGITVSTYLYTKYPISMKKGVAGALADDVAKNTSDIAAHNTTHKQKISKAYGDLVGKAENGFIYDLNSTLGLLIDILKKGTYSEDVVSKIEALENSVYPDALKLPAGISTGTYTLEYETVTNEGTDAEAIGRFIGIHPICTFTVDSAAQTIAYNGFIAENVAPKLANKIGIYNEANTRVGEIALGLLSATRYYANLTPEYTFAAVSDTHVGEEGAADDFADAVKYFDNNADIEFVAICGDCVDDATEVSQLQTYQNIITSRVIDEETGERALISIPIYVVMGNHESVNMDVSGKEVDISGNYASISQYFDRVSGKVPSGESEIESVPHGINQGLYYSFEKNGDVFIMVGAYGNYNYDRTFSTAELQWLYETLEANRNKRCFLFHHYFPKNGSGDALNCYAKNDGLRGVQGEIFYSLLRHYKNVLYFHGHSHAKFNAQELNRYNTIDKEYGMYSIHIPSLTKPKYPNATQSEYLPDWEAGEGYVVDVYSTGVRLTGVDFENLTDEGQPYHVPIGSYWLPTTLKTIEAGTYYDETGTIKS